MYIFGIKATDHKHLLSCGAAVELFKGIYMLNKVALRFESVDEILYLREFPTGTIQIKGTEQCLYMSVMPFDSNFFSQHSKQLTLKQQR